jgi:TonB family protein
MTSIRVRHTLRLLCCAIILTAHPRGAAGQGVADIEASAMKGNFQQAFVQSRAVVVVAPTLDGITAVRAVFARNPQIQSAGVSSTERLIDAARTEQDLVGIQSELRYFVKLVNFVICDPGALAALQARFVAAASRLILDAGIPVTFESTLLADWTASTGSVLDNALERRIYQNSMANIAARDPRDTPSVLMADRLFRYLLREPEAREKAFATLQRVQWEARELDGPMRYVYPEFVKQRREALGLPELATPVQNENPQLGSSLEPKWNLPPSAGTGEGQFGEALQFDTRGVEFGPWVRRFLAQVRRNWFIPYAAMSLRGHVAVSFNVHKDGTITDVVVARSCTVEVFNESSYKAVAASNPTVPLPPEYPDEKALITISFHYNETPPQK